MTSWTPYLWKEYRQSRRFGLAILGVFLGISLGPWILDTLLRREPEYDYTAEAVFLLGGPFLAVMAGVHAMGREQGRIERFWRAQPINLNRWFVSKYLTGFFLVCLACWLPLSIEIMCRHFGNTSYHLDQVAPGFLVYSLVLLLIYSVSFVLGVCIRSTLHSAILAMGAAAMIFLVPLVVEPLTWLNVAGVVQSVDNGSRYAGSVVAFGGTMIALSLALLWLAGTLLKWNARIDVDRRTLSWSLAMMMLVLFAGIAFPMGTNIPAQQVISMPNGLHSMVCSMIADGNDILVLFQSRPEQGSSAGGKYGLVRVHVGRRMSTMDEPIWLAANPEKRLDVWAYGLAQSAESPSLAYTIITQVGRQDPAVENRTLSLCTIALDSRQDDSIVHRVELNPLLGTREDWTTICVRQGRLYIYCREHDDARLLTFSLADPLVPLLLHNDVLHDFSSRLNSRPSGRYEVRLMPIADLDDFSRLGVMRKLGLNYFLALTGDGRVLASVDDPGSLTTRLLLLEVDSVRDDVMSFHSVAQRREAILAGLLRSSSYGVSCLGSLACQFSSNGATFHRIRESSRIERIGHYAAGEDFNAMVTLPHNRVVLAGKRLHVLDLSDRLSR
jgi:hypothetical protein